MKEKLIELAGVSKRYQHREILSGISLTVAHGQSIALIGHNGAGKSTLLKLIAGLVNPSTGRVIHRSKLRIGYIPEHFPPTSLTARQYIRCMGRIQGMDPKAIEQKSRQLFQAFFMESMTDIPMKHLSKGTLQKVGVIQAVLQRPDVLLLDEPLSGQDLDSQEVFIQWMNRLRAEGVALVMSCHEKHLYARISDTVYEVKNKGLFPLQTAPMPSAEFDRMVFTGQRLPDLSRFDARVEHAGQQTIITTPEAQSSELLLVMLKSGWKLREMNHAQNN